MVAITIAPTRFPSRPVLVVLPPVTRSGARIYRRRRLAVLGAALSLVLVAVLLISMAGHGEATGVQIAPTEAPIVHDPAAFGAGGQSVPARAVYLVQPGDTIWSIARQLDPSGDPRATVDRIVALNGGAALEPGQHLRLNDNGNGNGN
jgi:nucleoid-associated protein YgaU